MVKLALGQLYYSWVRAQLTLITRQQPFKLFMSTYCYFETHVKDYNCEFIF